MFFPALSWLTGILSVLHQWRRKEYSSPVFVPFIGPILLSGLVLSSQKSLWLLPLVWLADLGTVAFLVVSPRLITEWWRVSRFTLILKLVGSQDIQSAILTLHSGGHYLLEKSWSRPPGQLGIVHLGETGTFAKTDEGYELTSHFGLRRVLRKTTNEAYLVGEADLENENQLNYSLANWRLKVTGRSCGASE